MRRNFLKPHMRLDPVEQVIVAMIATILRPTATPSKPLIIVRNTDNTKNPPPDCGRERVTITGAAVIGADLATRRPAATHLAGRYRVRLPSC